MTHSPVVYCLTPSLFMIIELLFAFIVVREERGPYSDPQHPYFYEEEDVWMAPGFINQFYEVSAVINYLWLQKFLYVKKMKMNIGSVNQD